jgi:hypothetical protein
MVGGYPTLEGKMTDQTVLQEYLIDAIASVVTPRGGAYVAGPLATGRRYYELLSSGQDQAASTVRDENEREMKSFVASLRSKLHYPVIDPGILKIKGWTSRQMGDFYIRVVQLFAKEIWFMDGWEYSRGATKEFQVAVAHKIQCLNARGAYMSASEGCAMIAKAITDLTAMGIDASRFADRITAIRKA